MADKIEEITPKLLDKLENATRAMLGAKAKDLAEKTKICPEMSDLVWEYIKLMDKISSMNYVQLKLVWYKKFSVEDADKQLDSILF